jgi:hypothetical protein
LSLPVLESMSWIEKNPKKRREKFKKSRSGLQKTCDHYKKIKWKIYGRLHVVACPSPASRNRASYQRPRIGTPLAASTEPGSPSKAANTDAGAEPQGPQPLQRQRLGRCGDASGTESAGSRRPPALLSRTHHGLRLISAFYRQPRKSTITELDEH